MLESLISTTTSITTEIFIICTLVSLFLGFIVALTYKKEGAYSDNFLLSLIVLPTLVQMVIMMVNGNLGTSVAVLGTFGLVRFRSVPGTSKDICFIFLAMAIGLATGMGYVGFAVVTAIVTCFVILFVNKTNFLKDSDKKRDLRITIPEELDYTTVFDDIFEVYTKSPVLNRVKTTHLGSMYELKYTVELKDRKKEKEMLDEIRCRNGNLTIICGRAQTMNEQL